MTRSLSGGFLHSGLYLSCLALTSMNAEVVFCFAIMEPHEGRNWSLHVHFELVLNLDRVHVDNSFRENYSAANVLLSVVFSKFKNR